VTDNATAQADTSLEAATTDDAVVETKGTTEPDPIALARKRQAGADAARLIAEAKAADYEKELAKYRAAAQTDAEKDLTELAKQTARAEAAEKAAADAETKATAKVLDKLYPKARAEFPEVADEAKLAKLEVILADDEETPPTPRGVNAPNGAATAGAGAKPLTIKDMEARILAEAKNISW
jgi:hypothetical protein